MFRQKFNEIIAYESNLGFQRGMALFVEEINNELLKEEKLGDLDAYLDNLVESYTPQNTK